MGKGLWFKGNNLRGLSITILSNSHVFQGLFIKTFDNLFPFPHPQGLYQSEQKSWEGGQQLIAHFDFSCFNLVSVSCILVHFSSFRRILLHFPPLSLFASIPPPLLCSFVQVLRLRELTRQHEQPISSFDEARNPFL